MAFDDNVLLFAPRGAITPAELDDLAAIDPARPFRTLIEAIEAGGFKNKAGALTVVSSGRNCGGG